MAQSVTITAEDLAQRVEEAPGKIAVATLLELRSAYNRGRATPGVLEWIKSRLRNDHSIGVMTDGSEPSQEQEVYLYALNAPIATIMSAAVNPSETGLRRLRDVAGPARRAAEADENIATIRAALDDATSALEEFVKESD